MLFELLGKILDVHHAAVKGDGLYLKIGRSQKMLCVLHALCSDIRGHRWATYHKASRIAQERPF